MSYGDFERLVHGEPAEPKEEKTELKGKFSTVPVDTDSLFSKESDTDSLLAEEEATPEETSLGESLKQAMANQQRSRNEPPRSFSRNPEDLTQPAIWRKNLNGLKRNIDLTSDD